MNPPFDLATVEAPFFEPLTGQSFVAHPIDSPELSPLTLELAQVLPFHHRAGSAGRAPFSLLFKAPDSSRIPQGIYECDGPGLAREPIFLVPVRDPLRGLCMEAVFN